MSGRDPGLSFWLSYVEYHGGLIETVPGGALAVLPEPLQARLGLVETVTVTADPEVSREDGSLLLAAGHPVLTLAAESVLAAADVGRRALAWPADQVPAGGDLLERARDTFPVDHGRIDPAGPPTRSYLPVIRAGAMIRYTVAGDEAFQERAECWLDAGTLRQLPDAVRGAVESEPSAAPDSAPVLPYDLDRAVTVAHELLTGRAARRLETLENDGGQVRADEVARTEAYYRDVLAGIERRRPGTAPDRLAALDARAEATRAERARRLAEIGDKHRPTLALTPYRLQLVLVPAVVLPVDVLRGSRAYPQRLVWIWPARTFSPLPCPTCGSDQRLVAGKTALGCQACTTRPAAPADRPPAKPAPVRSPAKPAPVRSPVKPASGRSASGRPEPAKPGSGPAAKASAVKARASSATAAARALAPAVRTHPAEPHAHASKVRTTGDQLMTGFWQAVSNGDRHLIKRLVPASPAATSHRLFGVRGLVCAVGIPPGSMLEAVAGGTRDPGPGDRYVSEGWLQVREHHGVRFPFALTWRLSSGRPVVEEILPFAASDPSRLPHGWFMTPGTVVLDALPGPAVLLDPVASALTDEILPLEGLPLLTRCLTAWWRLDAPLVEVDRPPRVTAAALLRLVSWRSGARVPTAECARRFGVTVEQIKAAESALKTTLRLSADVVW